MDISTVQSTFFLIIIIILSILLLACLLRAIIGPRVADRIVAVNMMGTIVMVTIGVLTFMMNESFLLDICLVYAMISFLAVVVLSKVYIGIYNERKERKKNEH